LSQSQEQYIAGLNCLFDPTKQKTNTSSAYFSHKQTKPLAWLAVRTGLFGGGGQQLVCVFPKTTLASVS
jgi:hypothetical protein